METLDFEQLEELFFELAALDGEGRAARLEQIRAHSAETALRLERMMAVDERPTSDPQVLSPLGRGSTELEIGDSVGPFELVRLLGEGGMGLVYEARQMAPVERRVAIKVIKMGLDTRAVLARFEAERRALALMEHPNIARVYEAGAADNGRPYFAMELVEGLPINQYCLKYRLSMTERLRLLMDVCGAVQHAHRKGIIHRDLKPSNVLVAEGNGEESRPTVKVIDFGIAKAVTDGDDLKTRFTQHGQLVGTLEYMSPEQVQGDEIDTRSDVYSLGVLLFELLVGELPIKGEEIRSAGFESMRQRIAEHETPRPSDRVKTITSVSRELAAERRTDPASLARLLRQDLDWIVVKALAKQRDHRYESPAELASEIGRYLANEPILAGPPTFRYRSRKFLRRNRAAVLVAAALVLALGVGVAGLSVGLIRAQRAEAVAVRESEVSKEVLQFMRSVLSEGASQASQGHILTTPELFARAEERLNENPPSDPRVYGTILNRIAEFYFRDLEDFVVAEPLLEKASELLRSTDGAEVELASVQYMLGILHRMRGDLEAATRFHDEALALKLSAAQRGERDVIGTSEIIGEQALILAAQRRPEEGLVLMREALEMVEAEHGPEFVESVSKRVLMAGLLTDLGRLDEADQELLRALEVSETKEYWKYVAIANNDLGANGFRRGQLSVAYERFQRALEINRERLGEGPMLAAVRMSNIGMVAARRGDYKHAEEWVRAALELMIPAQTERSVSAIISNQILGEVLLRDGQLEAAKGVLEAVLPLAYDAPGLDAPIGPFRAERNLAQIEAALGRDGAARRRLDRAIEHQEWSELDPVGRCEMRVVRAGLEERAQVALSLMNTVEETCGETFQHPSVQYQAARVFAVKGATEQALVALEGLPVQRFIDAWHGRDTAFASLANEPRFRAFLDATAPG